MLATQFLEIAVLGYLKDVLESLLTLPPVMMQCLIIILDESILGYLYWYFEIAIKR